MDYFEPKKYNAQTIDPVVLLSSPHTAEQSRNTGFLVEVRKLFWLSVCGITSAPKNSRST